MSEDLRVLILEDQPADAELMLREMRKEGIEFTSLRVETERDFRKQLEEFRPALILADYSLPTYDGMSALAVAQEACPDVPFILVSGTLGEDTAVESLHRGATDYILKDRLSRLGAAVRRALLEGERRNELKQAEQRLRDSEMRYRRLFESAKDGVLILDADTGMVVDVNPFLTQLLGFSHEQFLGKKVWELGFFKDIVANRANFVELQQREYIRYEDMALETSDGRRVEVEFVSNVYLVNDHRVIQCDIRDITERKRAGEALRVSERRFQGLFESSRDAIMTLEPPSWKFTTGNPATVEMFGAKNEEEFISHAPWELSPERQPDGRASAEKSREMIERAIRDGSLFFEWTHRRLDGEEFAANVLLTRMELGRKVILQATVRDITERKRMEEALRTRKAELREAQRVSHVGSWDRVLPTGAIVWSEELCRIYGVDPNLPIPDFQNLAQFYTQESWARLRATVEKALETGAPFELDVQIVRTDGNVIWATTRGEVLRDAAGRAVGTRGTVLDITERKRAEAQREQLAALVEATPDFIGIADAKTTQIQYINKCGRRMCGLEEDEDVGTITIGDLHPAWMNKRLAEVALPAAVRDGLWEGEGAFLHRDGREIPVLMALLSRKAANGEVDIFCTVSHDITGRKRLEAQFLQAQKMEGVGQLAGGIAHDFNNLLTVINGMSDLVLAQIGEDDPVHADVQEIHRAGERAATLTRQLLAFSRQQILEPRVLNVNTVVAGMESLLRRLLGEDIDLVVVLAPDLGRVKADPGQIEQVISNLAVNARDAMPHGGRLTIETRNVMFTEGDAFQHGAAVPPGAYAQLAVSDSGVGMDEATRARIFEPFFTTKGPGKGTGLGLSTVYGIVKQSQGFIWVHSEVGQGTSFEICLPQVTEAATIDPPAPTVVSSSGTETILLAEDNATLRNLAARFLAPAGYTVLDAASGEEALLVLERHAAPVHLLLSDVVMPGMSGRDLAEQLAKTQPAMKVLYMSGYTADTILRHGVLDTQMPFLNKPFTKAALLRKVREVLDSHA